MNKFIATAAAACFALGSAAHAATISVSAFDISSFDSATGYTNFVVQDFEDVYGDGSQTVGQLAGPLATNVGTFSAISEDASGSGSTCNASGGDCTQLFLNNTTVNGQGNMVPDDGIWSLNANDTFGILWDVVKGEGGSLFNRVVFGMMDAADTGAMVRVSVGDVFVEFKNLLNANQQLIVINFGELVDMAQIEIRSSRLNDSFSIDGASVGVVPLPAGGLLLLTGFGALALRRRRKAA
ncbi:VPLPA-CTERM sorting domain-containing protein [Yoonia sp.]|uniref:VPLPA-CTERM sorting domain-containing protein n=1 Tax=Yoonia sp. TaxID=2212373 RepID=UPI0025EA8465|nr:VPLPA-CTERM sorting domain-containing protein [Yoonia sp.]